MVYDVIIIGLGPAGLSAAIYAARYNLKCLAIGSVLAGNMGEAWKIENYPGFEHIAGLELGEKMKRQAKKLGAKIEIEEVIKINSKSQTLNSKQITNPKFQTTNFFQIKTRSGKSYESRALILALGTQHRKLNVKGEDKFQGRGVAYCATCDAAFFKNKPIAVVGGGDSAIKSAILVSQYASRVYLIVRGDKLTGEPKNIAQIQSLKPRVQILFNSEIIEIGGEKTVSGIILKNNDKIAVSGVFIEIGLIPTSALLAGLKVELDKNGFIEVDQWQKTNIPLVYAAGDITTQNPGFKQILTAASQGAVAAFTAYKDLKQEIA